MAPGLIDNEISESFSFNVPVNKSVFPDGLKTSGQQEPVYSWIQPYSQFPKEITGQTLWTSEDFKAHPEKWTHVFTPEEVAEIEVAADSFIERGLPLTGITKVYHQEFHASRLMLRICRTSSNFRNWLLVCKSYERFY